jgi:hypothetical protein
LYFEFNLQLITINNVYEIQPTEQFSKRAVHQLPGEPTLKIQLIHAQPKAIELKV